MTKTKTKSKPKPKEQELVIRLQRIREDGREKVYLMAWPHGKERAYISQVFDNTYDEVEKELGKTVDKASAERKEKKEKEKKKKKKKKQPKRQKKQLQNKVVNSDSDGDSTSESQVQANSKTESEKESETETESGDDNSDMQNLKQTESSSDSDSGNNSNNNDTDSTDQTNGSDGDESDQSDGSDDEQFGHSNKVQTIKKSKPNSKSKRKMKTKTKSNNTKRKTKLKTKFKNSSKKNRIKSKAKAKDLKVKDSNVKDDAKVKANAKYDKPIVCSMLGQFHAMTMMLSVKPDNENFKAEGKAGHCIKWSTVTCECTATTDESIDELCNFCRRAVNYSLTGGELKAEIEKCKGRCPLGSCNSHLKIANFQLTLDTCHVDHDHTKDTRPDRPTLKPNNGTPKNPIDREAYRRPLCSLCNPMWGKNELVRKQMFTHFFKVLKLPYEIALDYANAKWLALIYADALFVLTHSPLPHTNTTAATTTKTTTIKKAASDNDSDSSSDSDNNSD